MVEEEKMSLVRKKDSKESKVLRFLATFFQRREPLLLVILISLEWASLAALVFEDEDETGQKDESMSNPFRQN